MKKYKVKESELTGLEIAIIGMDCKMPGADNVEEFWKNITEGKDCISFFTDKEMEESGIDKSLYTQENYVKAKGIIKNVDRFDNKFFNYTPEESSIMDPQLRIMHECVYHGLEDAGYLSYHYKGDIGVFLGNFTNYSWLNTLSANIDNAVQKLLLGSLNDINSFSTRVAYNLNLTGPAISVETACSTSLVATHLACQSLLAGDCDMAVAGGVSITVPIKEGYLYEEGMIYAKDGYCHAFANDASGSVFSDGAGVIVLKTLENAIRDNDNIYAVIKGTSINNDGLNKAGFSAPSVLGEARAIRNAIYAAQVKPEDIGYIETHGTATQLGDPIEIEALKKAFHTSKRNYCAIGSVKTNIGHTNNASGIAGIIKTALSLKNKVLTPSLHFQEPNDKIDFENSPFYVNTELKEWKSEGKVRIAGVSSFGIGGTNAHVILEEPPEAWIEEEIQDVNCILLSAKSQKSLDDMTEQLEKYIEHQNSVSIQDIAYSLSRRNGDYKYRRYFLNKTLERNTNFLKKGKNRVSEYMAYDNNKLVFVFPGQGSEYKDMMKGLYQKHNVFKDGVDECARILEQMTGIDFVEVLYGSEEEYRASEIQLLLFTVEYALAKTLEFYGIQADIMIGYSFGEYVAACLSGVLALKDALKLVVQRGKLMRKLKGTTMLSVPLSEDKIKETLKENLYLSIINEETCTVSGTVEDLEEYENELRNKRIICSKVPAIAGHCGLLKTIEEDYRKVLRTVDFGICNKKYISCILADEVSGKQLASVDYWIQHMLNPVRFSDSIKKIIENYGSCTFVEVGPGMNLSALINRFSFCKDEHIRAINMTRNKKNEQDDYEYLLNKICLLWSIGHTINKEALLWRNRKNYINMPLYPFAGEKFKIAKIPQNRNNIISDKWKKKSLESWLYSMNWKKQKFVEQGENSSDSYIILCDSLGYAKEAAEQISATNKVYLIKNGVDFKRIGDMEYQISIGEESDYILLMKNILEQDTVYNVLNFLSADNLKEEMAVDIKMENAFYALLYFVKAFQKENAGKKNSLKICNLALDCYKVEGNEMLNPFNAGAISLGIVIAQEHPTIKTKCIEFSSKDSGLAHMASTLVEESLSYDQKIVAYRRNSRYFPTFEQMYVPNSIKNKAIKDGDTVFIIGGMGNVGLSLAQGISKMNRVNLILTSTHDMKRKNGSISPEKEIYLEEIEKSGSSVIVRKCDLNVNLSEVLEETVQTFGKIHTIIFSAGVIGEKTFGLLEDVEQEMFNAQFKVKIEGLIKFAEVVGKYGIDNCILTSSVSSILGGIGHSVYATSNLFMDLFARMQNEKENTRWLTVDWDFWKFDTNREEGYIGTTAKELSLSREEGIKLVPFIFRLLDEEQIMISTGDLTQRFEKWVNIEEAKSSQIDEIKYKRPDLTNEYIPPNNEVEIKMVGIWEKILGYKGIGIEDNFFELGGDSLKEVEFSIQLKKELGLEFALTEFYNHPYIKDIATLCQAGSRESKVVEYQDGDNLPVSLEQKRMYMLYRTDKKSLAYNTSLCMMIEGELDISRLEDAFCSVLKENEILLSNYYFEGDNIIQKINKNREFHIQVSSVERNEIDNYIDSFICPYNLEKDILIRAGIAKLQEQQHILIIDLHHIVADGISVELIKQQLVQKYFGMENKKTERKQYLDYIHWQLQNIKQGKFDEMGRYWKQQFANQDIPQIEWPVERNSKKIEKERNGKSGFFVIEKELYNQLKEYSVKHSVTLYMLLLASYNVLLHKMTSGEEFIIGMPISCRDNEEFRDIIGMMLNTLPLKNTLNGTMKFEEFLQNVCTCCLNAFSNKNYPYENILEDVSETHNLSDNSLYDTMLVLQNMKNVAFNFQGWRISDYNIKGHSSKVAISFEFAETNETLQCKIEYDADIFSEKVLNRFIKGFRKVFEAIVKESNIEIQNINILEDDLPMLLRKDRYIPYSYDEAYTVIDMFREQAEKSKQYDAVYSLGTTLTYWELENLTNFVAAKLRKELDIVNDKDYVAGILSDRTYEMIVLVIAYWKAGIAYTPLEANIPMERFQYILSDSEACAVTCSSVYYEKALEYCKGRIRCIDYAFLTDGYEKDVVYDVINICKAERSAYIIYTSGTTGKPKGVLIRHKNIVNSVIWRKQEFGLGHEDRVLQMFSFLFDGFVVSFLQPLVSGSVLHVIGDERANDIPYIAKYIVEKKITNICAVPPLFGAIVECLKEEELKYLNIVSLAGDKLKKEVVDSAKRKNPNMEICNEYGPTEASVVVSCNRNVTGDNCNILGKPIFNTHLLVLDKCLKLSPVNVPGQLCISGKGIASGYLNLPELTKEKFVQSPYFEDELMYLTGDIAKINEKGEIEFIGRKDSQIKIHGFRIESDEITNALLEHENIDDVCVVAKDNGNEKFLCAFYVAKEELELFQLKKYLYQKLPAYMIPAHFIKIEALPLTPNGKIDEKTLKNMPIDISVSTEKYMPPTNELESELVEIWSEIFHVENIGIDTNFFDMGGNSINVVKMHNEIMKRHDIDLSITIMYKCPTIRMLAEYIKEVFEDNVNHVSEQEEAELNESIETFEEAMSLFGEDNFE